MLERTHYIGEIRRRCYAGERGLTEASHRAQLATARCRGPAGYHHHHHWALGTRRPATRHLLPCQALYPLWEERPGVRIGGNDCATTRERRRHTDRKRSLRGERTVDDTLCTQSPLYRTRRPALPTGAALCSGDSRPTRERSPGRLDPN